MQDDVHARARSRAIARYCIARVGKTRVKARVGKTRVKARAR